MEKVPIRVIDPSSRLDRQCHSQIVEYVQSTLQLQKDLACAKTPGERTSLERQAASTDREIDRLVYALYGLTEEEIRIVEGAAQG
jgi:hypothetical protein